jgi:hypothetical protein
VKIHPQAARLGLLGAVSLFALFPAIAEQPSAIAVSAQPWFPSNHLWKPVADEVWLQEIGQKIVTPKAVDAVGTFDRVAYVVTDGGLKRVESGRLQDVTGAPRNVRRLRVLDGALWALAADGLYKWAGKAWDLVDGREFVDLCLHLGKVHAATRTDIFRLEANRLVNIRPPEGYLSTDTTVIMEDYSQVLADPVEIGPVERIASYSGTLYLLRRGGLALIEGKTFVPDPVDWGTLPSRRTRDFLSQGSRLYVSTDRGLGVLRGMALTRLSGVDGLPYEDLTCLAQGFDGDLWIGTTLGAIRKTGNDFHYFGAQHWLPQDGVRDIAVDGHTVYIATDGGLGIIRYEPCTLAEKAAFFEREMNTWGFKRLGFVHKLYWSGDKDGWLREISDNDGGNTSHLLAAMSFKYAVTGDEQDRAQAVDAFKAMVWLDEITPKPGFIARAIWSVPGDKGERSTRGSGGLPAKWYPTEDKLWLWKGDTSSDEVNAHYYAVTIFHDLAAKGAEKERAKQHIANITSHIMDNGWVLRDMDGKPTRWGRWDPDYLLRPYGFESRGLNGMEAQTYVTTALSLTGDGKYQDGLQQVLKWRYHTFTVRERQTFPPEASVPWDDELAFYCYHALLPRAKDPYLRSIYLRSLERTWEILRIQQLPFYNFIYGAITGNDCEAPEAAQHLRDWSLDLVNHRYRNSHRADLWPRPGYVAYGGGTRAISPRESEAKWGTRLSLEYDGGEDSRGVTPPTGWIEDYWMGRYYGFIEAPKSTAAAGEPLEKLVGPHSKALLYDGPPRPRLKFEQ